MPTCSPSTAPDDAYLAHELFRYFPPMLTDRYPDAVAGHRLRREVIATVLANADDQSRRAGLCRQDDGRDQRRRRPGGRRLLPRARRLWARAALRRDRRARRPDLRHDAARSLCRIGALLERETLWLLRNADFTQPLGDLVLRYAAGRDRCGGAARAAWCRRRVEASHRRARRAFTAGGAPPASPAASPSSAR